ncbi:MAG TPA: PaaI family thioesterase [Thermoanaerobaculia bacterium]|nr:PaaI family thioesterase [Thermoanaerobaculia bacterium]
MSVRAFPSPVLAADLTERLRGRLAASPALAHLQPVLEELGPDTCTMRLPYRPDLANLSGTVHGGVLAMLADTAVAFALSTNFDGKMGFATADLTIHFLARARADVWARARILKKGRRVNVGDVDMTDAAGRAVARALATFVLTTSTFEYAPEGKKDS